MPLKKLMRCIEIKNPGPNNILEISERDIPIVNYEEVVIKPPMHKKRKVLDPYNRFKINSSRYEDNTRHNIT